MHLEAVLPRVGHGQWTLSLPMSVPWAVVKKAALVRRLVALVPPPRRHLTSFHGVYAPHAALRPVVTQPVESPPARVPTAPAPGKKGKRHLDWATLHQAHLGH